MAYHPLRGVRQDKDSHLRLRFAGSGLESSTILGDVKVYNVRFYGGEDEERSWANPIRSIILQRLAGEGRNWYLNINDRPFDDTKDYKCHPPLHKEISDEFSKYHKLQYVTFRDNRGQGLPEEKRAILVERYGLQKIQMFFEAPNHLIDEIISRYWPRIAHGAASQGYLLPGGEIAFLEDWNTQVRDDRLFRKIKDTVPFAFLAKGGHSSHLIFLTAMFSFDEFKAQIDFSDLQTRTRKLTGKI